MENISEQIISVINEIALKLGIAAEKLYPMLRKQAMIDGFLNIFYVLIAGAILFLLYKAVCICYIKKDTNFYNFRSKFDQETACLIFLLIGIPILIACIISILVCMASAINIFCNPDWYIINNILKGLVR